MAEELKEIEEAFRKTSKLVLGKELSGLRDYEKWLLRNTPGHRILKSADSGKTIILSEISVFREIPEEIISGMDSEELNSKKTYGLNQDFFGMAEGLKGKVKLITELKEGNNHRDIESNIYMNDSYVYRTNHSYDVKFCAYSTWSSLSENMFGCYRAINSRFSVNCYNSTKLTRCFEMDSCYDCSDSMFCHNCENVNESLFCFNAKNLRWAVGNTVVGKEEFLRIRKIVLDHVLEELEGKGDCEMDVYNIGSKIGNLKG